MMMVFVAEMINLRHLIKAHCVVNCNFHEKAMMMAMEILTIDLNIYKYGTGIGKISVLH